MNLTVIENNVIKQMPVTHQEYVIAKFKKQIKAFDDFDLEKSVKDLIVVTLTESGVRDAGDSKVTTFLRETLFKDLKHPKYSNLTFEEIKLALHKGVRQEYGPFMGVNIQTIHSWIKAYLNSKERELAIKEFYAKADEQDYGKQDKSSPPNPEGQKRLCEMLKDVVKGISEPEEKRREKKPIVKSDRDIFIQNMMTEFENIRKVKPGIDEKTKKELPGMFIQFEDRAIDLTEFLTIKLTDYDTNN